MKKLTTALLLALGVLAVRGGEAEDRAARLADRVEPKEWSYVLTPYLWMLSIDGTVGANGVSAPASMTFSELFDVLDFAAAARFEGQKGRWGFFFDGFYSKVSDETDDVDLASALPSMSLKKPKIPGPALRPGSGKLLKAILKRLPPAQRRRVLKSLVAKGSAAAAKLRSLRLPSIEEVELELALAIVEAGASYLLCEMPLNEAETQVLTFEALAGARYTYLKSEIDIDIAPGSFGILPSHVSIEESKDWLDPLIGARVRAHLTDRVTLSVRADASGFGVGSASKLTWQVTAGATYDLSDRTSLFVGYRYYDLEYERGGFEFDAVLKNPIVGVGIRF